jgi:hypothetical protein
MDQSDKLSEAASLLGRKGAASRQVVTSACAVCGNPITGLRNLRYCGLTCKKRAYRDRKRGELAPATRPTGRSLAPRLHSPKT